MSATDDAFELLALRDALPAVNYQVLCEAMNARASRAIEMLNALVQASETRLRVAETALEDAERRATLLEIALEGVKGEFESGETDVEVRMIAGGDVGATEPAMETVESASEASSMSEAEDAATSEPPAVAHADARDAMLDDPVYSIYFKMLKIGVPEQAVRNKMALDGVDESALDRR